MQLLVDVSPSDPYLELYDFGWALEWPLFYACLLVALFAFIRVFPLDGHRMFARAPNPGLGVVRAAVLFAGLWFWFILQTGAASDIVGFYTGLYVFLAYALLLTVGFRFPVLGVYYRADVLERGNLAAGLLVAGFALGTAFAYGGALTGEGPGWWVVVVFFALAYWELRANVALSGRLGSLKDEVRLERDVSAGALLGAVAVSSGLIAGRAAAGDFHGWETDMPDYLRRLWPLVLVPLVANLAGAYTRFHPRKDAIRLWVAGALVLGGLLYYFLT